VDFSYRNVSVIAIEIPPVLWTPHIGVSGSPARATTDLSVTPLHHPEELVRKDGTTV